MIETTFISKRSDSAVTNISNRSVRLACKSLAVAIGLSFASLAFGQATTGRISGQVPVASGETVKITGGSGFHRTIPVSETGHYSITLPVGTYDVILMQHGQVIQRQRKVLVTAAGAREVDFTSTAAPGSLHARTLSTVNVSAATVPPIDIRSTNQNTTITAMQLERLPLGRNAASIALLAPGTTAGAAWLPGGLVSFGGSSVDENTYYINGFNTTNPITDLGGVTLPYNTIAEQQTLTSGYGARYGRSMGGVISQIGKRGTNAFHFGGRALWQPRFAQSKSDNWYFGNPRVTTPGQRKGDIYIYRNGDNSWSTTYDLYASGPIIPNRLTFFASAELNMSKGNGISPISSRATNTFIRSHSHDYYLALDWNINDSNILSFTGIQDTSNSSSSSYEYDYTTHTTGGFVSKGILSAPSTKLWIAKYTSYITSNVTLNALYGQMTQKFHSELQPYPGFDPTVANVLSEFSDLENPAYTGGAANGITSTNTIGSIPDPRHRTRVHNLRVDLNWQLGEHDIEFGIDNEMVRDLHDGYTLSGPGYAWVYGRAPSPTAPIIGNDPNAVPYVGPTGPNPGGAEGYWVGKTVNTTSSSVKVAQRAQYVQDNWQVMPNVLLKLGMRNSQFVNYNPEGVPYIRLTKPQWAPRIGFSWDVNGDSTLKVFGNAGRYYLALPANVALVVAGSQLRTQEYFTYTGINDQGEPTGLHPIKSNPQGPINLSGNGGVPPDPRTLSSPNIKAPYQDQFVLGALKQLNASWVVGVTGIVNVLGRDIKDAELLSPAVVSQLLIKQGLDPGDYNIGRPSGGELENPDSELIYLIPRNDGGGYARIAVDPQKIGFPKMKRKYYSLTLLLKHPWNGKWQGEISYVFSKSWGNNEGSVDSDLGQVSLTTTDSFGYQQLMSHANGYLPNQQRHVIKAFGTYQVLPGWTVSANLLIASGHPKACKGLFGPDETNPAFGWGNGNYFWCGGKPSNPGTTGFTPWVENLSLGTEYRPAWADRKLGFQLKIFNVMNQQRITQFYPEYGSTAAPDAKYLQPLGMESPRFVQFGVTYNW